MPMGSRLQRSYASAPPNYLLIELDAPQLPAPPLQQVLVAGAEELNETLKYVLDAGDITEIASNTVVLVDAVVQTNCPHLQPHHQTQ